MEGLCESQFWDSNLTWYTTNPDFTECFQQTVLVWVPCGFLWLLLFLEIHFLLKSNRRNITWSALNITKTVIVVALVILLLIRVGKNIYGREFLNMEFISSATKCITYVLVLHLIIYGSKYGMQTTGVQFIYWFLATVSEFIVFRSVLINYHTKYSEKGVTVWMSLVESPLIAIIFILSFFSDKSYKSQIQKCEKKAMKENPEINSSFTSVLTYTWLNSLIWKGYKVTLEMPDIYDLKNFMKAKTLNEKIEKYLPSFSKNIYNRNPPFENGKQKLSASKSSTKYTSISTEIEDKRINIGFVLLRAFGPSLIFPSICQLLADLLSFMSPVLIGWIIAFSSSDEAAWKGYYYSFMVLFVDVLRNLFLEYKLRRSVETGSCLTVSIMTAIYKKCFRISNSAQKEISVGYMVNCVSVDATRFWLFLWKVHNLWQAPLIIILASIYLWHILGISAFAGILVMVLLIPLNIWLSQKRKVLQEKLMVCKDKRVKMMSEVLNGIRVLKMYAWEKSFQNEVLKLRKKEASVLKKIAWLSGFSSSIWRLTPILVSFTSLTIYVMYSGSPLTAPLVFVSLQLFSILEIPLFEIPDTISTLLLTYVSLGRINKLLNCEEQKEYVSTETCNPNNALEIANGTFTWDVDLEPVLRKINMQVRKGSLVAILGQVGCGKSTLISAILGDSIKLEGNVCVNGKLAYVPQQSWIQNTTLKNNILFYRTFNAQTYEKIIEACALDDDIDVLPAFDKTEIGEKGINLSGGQKQRVSLARAVYLDHDIYLLDDPLGAVDSHTANHIFQNVIGPQGILKNKTRILITHNIAVLPMVEEIYVIADGEIRNLGKYNEVMTGDGEFRNYLMNHTKDAAVISDEDNRIESTNKINTLNLRNQPKWKSEKKTDKNEKSLSPNGHEKNMGKKIIVKEKVETGTMSSKIYLSYIQDIGWCWTTVILISLILGNILLMYSKYWLVLWTDNEEKNMAYNSTTTTHEMLTVFGVLNSLSTLTVFATAIAIALGTLAATIKMHSKMLWKVLRSPLHFFDTTPVGRILNRFTTDLDQTDQYLPPIFDNFFVTLFHTISFIIATSVVLPSFLFGVVLVIVPFFVFQRFYIRTNVQFKRMSATASSLIVTHVSDSMSGSSLIRALDATETFTSRNNTLMDEKYAIAYLLISSFRWATLRLSFLVSLLLFATTICSTIAKGSISPGTTGFVLTNVNNIVRNVLALVIGLTTVEGGAVSIERIVEYFHIESECQWENPETKPNSNWPSKGKIVFWKYSSRYRKGLDLVLNNVSFVINPMEKVGVVGRTGAGKSSLAQALFRMIEPVSGEMIIDDVNISKIGLHDLRSKLTIIPQDPVLFSGTLRFNLDPFNQYKDEDIWEALEHSHLKVFVKSLEFGLNHEIAEGGKNISVGQRQMVCLTRALLKKSKILVLDEATASVDLDTDDLIQATIKEKFKYCTVLTIAHRLNTIMEYNRILVIEEGTVAEFDTPSTLLSNSSSVFYGLAKDAGLV